MKKTFKSAWFLGFMIFFLFLFSGGKELHSQEKDYTELLSLYKEFKQVQQPVMNQRVPDYTPDAMAEQYSRLENLQRKLTEMNCDEWAMPQKIDYHLVRAEMNGLEYNHRVLKPWSRDPGFYSTVPRFQETQAGAFRLPRLPLPESETGGFWDKLNAVPKILLQARSNIQNPPHDLALLAVKMKEREAAMYREFIPELKQHHPQLVPAAEAALSSIENFHDWMGSHLEEWSAPAGVGIENYNWYLKNVYLFPYNWKECVDLVTREYDRALVRLKMEEHRTRDLPPLQPVDTAEEFRELFNRGQKHLIDFLRGNQILPQPDNVREKGAGRFNRSEGRNFFEQVLDRDPLPLQPHDMAGHSPDQARVDQDDRPIPRVYRDYHISGIRAEALATGMEEVLMHAGLLDEFPRSRQLTYMLRIFRASRAMADLKMHSNELGFEEALEFCAAEVPYGWARADSFLIWDDHDLYIRQPGYGMGYLMGSVQLEKLMADYARLKGKDFHIQDFMREFLEPGMVPLSLIRWKMTGKDDEIKRLMQ